MTPTVVTVDINYSRPWQAMDTFEDDIAHSSLVNAEWWDRRWIHPLSM